MIPDFPPFPDFFRETGIPVSRFGQKSGNRESPFPDSAGNGKRGPDGGGPGIRGSDVVVGRDAEVVAP